MKLSSLFLFGLICASPLPPSARAEVIAILGPQDVADCRVILGDWTVGPGATVRTTDTLSDAEGDVFRAEWVSGGVKVVLEVPRKGGEDDKGFAQRCNRRLEAFKAIFPPDPK